MVRRLRVRMDGTGKRQVTARLPKSEPSWSNDEGEHVTGHAERRALTSCAGKALSAESPSWQPAEAAGRALTLQLL
jgi:hypothetical protein